MKREMEEYGLPEPEFYEERGSFKVIFRNGVVNNSGQQSDIQSDIQSDTQRTTTQETTQETTREITQEIMISMNDVQRKIIELMIDNPFITQKEMATKLDITRDGIKYNIKVLLERTLVFILLH